MKGCEDDNLILHFTSSHLSSVTVYGYYYLEFLSRARKRLWVMMEEKELKADHRFAKTISEMMHHDQKDCGNKVCKKEGWAQKKALNVKYVDVFLDLPLD